MKATKINFMSRGSVDFDDSTQFDTIDDDELAQLWFQFSSENGLIDIEEVIIPSAESDDRISRIRKAAEKRDAEKAAEEARKASELEAALQKVHDLEGRVSDLIILANECLRNGYDIGKYTDHLYAKNDPHYFLTDGWNHQIGFITRRVGWHDVVVEAVGIENGGACGSYDLIVTGEDTFYRHENYTCLAQLYGPAYKTPDIRDLNKFLAGFDKFEKRFLDYVDSL